MSATDKLPAFQQYQLEFAGHIRNPRHTPRPSRVPASRMRVYTEIVFNNLEASLATCFPVCKAVLGKRAWHKLIRGFFVHHQSLSPLFRQIPEEFLAYLEDVQAFDDVPRLPCYLKGLAHYEWIELAVSATESSIDMTKVDAEGNLLLNVVVLTPTLRLLAYDYPVHRISPKKKPVAALEEPVYLAVYRDLNDEVRFVEINQLTFRLLSLLQQAENSGEAVLRSIAEEMQYTQPEKLIEFGLPILQALKAQQLILGTRL